MKKILNIREKISRQAFLMLTFIFTLFVYVNNVKADGLQMSTFYNNFDKSITYYNTYKSNIDELVSRWETNYKTTYPYYVLRINFNTLDTPKAVLLASSSNKTWWNGDLAIVSTVFDSILIMYDPDSNAYTEEQIQENFAIYDFTFAGDPYLEVLYNNGFVYNSTYSSYTSLVFPNFTSSTFDFSTNSITVTENMLLPSYLPLYDNSYNPNYGNDYTEIDLNKYPYVILSLKDYTSRDTFESTMYVKGQLCPTTVYNYGMEEKKDYVSGYQTQPCSYYYNNFTPFTSYIKSEDIENHAVYYLTTYDKSKPNLVQVDNSVYDITYITSENENDPYVSIEGKKYPALSYSGLTDSATLTEKNGISNEWTCAKYDTDCLLNSSGIDIDDLFSKPLEFLKDLWSSITSIFNIITEFISLLPETMQSFLYLSFMIAIILGLLKLIL